MEGDSVKIPQGIIQGSWIEKPGYHRFLGVPYAKPPVGDLRFKDPLPPDPWTGIKIATQEPPTCYSMNEISGKVEGSEDCLFLNIYTKSLTTKKPVMVWLPGGAFLRGTISPQLYGPEFFMHHDVVLVAVQYRLGVLGFLRLRDEYLGIHGNYGLKDQNMALQWVQNNIEQFGGDPANVTLFGNSAGGTSVHYHLLSPMSRGLFHKAIIQSGSAIKACLECSHNPVHMAKLYNGSISNEKEALDLFQALPVEDLYALQDSYVKANEADTINKFFGPIVEPPSVSNPFITKPPIDIIRSKKYNDVPMIVGYNTKEGLIFERYKQRNAARILSIDHCIRPIFNLPQSTEQKQIVVDRIKKEYFNEGLAEDNMIELLGDVGYVIPMIAVATNHARTSKHPVFLYRCSLDTKLNFLKHQFGLSHKKGTSHFDEVSYLFNNFRTQLILSSSDLTKEQNLITRMVNLWTNFAIYNNPTPDNDIWKPYRDNEKNFVDIGEELINGRDPDRERVEFWKRIYGEFEETKSFL